MRNRHLLLIFSAIAALSLSACDDDDLDATTDGAADSDGSTGDAGPGKDGGAGDSGNADSSVDGGTADGGEADSGEDGGAADGGEADSGEDGGDADGGDAGSDGAVVATCAIACANFNDCSAACSQNLVELCLTACEESQAAALNAIENCSDAISLLDLAAQCAFHVDLGETCDANHLCSSPAECMDGTCRQHVELGDACDDNHLCTDPAECVDGHCRQYVGLNQNCDDDHLCSEGYCFSGTCHPYVEAGGDCDANQLCGDGLGCHLGVCKTLVAAKATCDEDHICAGQLRCIEGLCKRPAGYLYGKCSSSDECITGICQQDIHGNGPYCLVDIGESSTSTAACVTYNYNFNTGRCAMPIGGACSQDADCDSHAFCMDGTCKRKFASDGDLCNDSSECATGASCQKNREGNGPYCYLDGGQATTNAFNCASWETYNDNGTQKCKSLLGGDCNSNANLCVESCDNGTCKKLGSRFNCSSNDECATGASCRKNSSDNGPYCLLSAGHETKYSYNCVSGAAYEENGVRICSALPGSDCSQNPQICAGVCDEDGICKKLGLGSGICSSNDECPTGASCQENFENMGPYCLLNGGQETTSESNCASYSVYEEEGLSKCTYLTGGDCTQNSEICAGVCEGGTCKRLGTGSGYCSSNDECPTGASCQENRYGYGPYCLLEGGQATEDAYNCASYEVYNDNGTQKCKYLTGGDCNTEPSLCSGRCEGGTCKRLGSDYGYCSSSDECPTGASCQEDRYGNGPYCFLDGGQKTEQGYLCASRNTYRSNGTDKCTSLLGGDCNTEPSLCAGRCEGGTCKRLGESSGYCSSNDECAAGASCQRDSFGEGPYCLLDGGQETTDDDNCASSYTYNDNGTRRCQYLTGGDCSQNVNICRGVCENGTCKLFGHGICSDSSECATGSSCVDDDGYPNCFRDDGEFTNDYSYCASHVSHLDNGIPVCGSAE